jgi:hypothetical protein
MGFHITLRYVYLKLSLFDRNAIQVTFLYCFRISGLKLFHLIGKVHIFLTINCLLHSACTRRHIAFKDDLLVGLDHIFDLEAVVVTDFLVNLLSHGQLHALPHGSRKTFAQRVLPQFLLKFFSLRQRHLVHLQLLLVYFNLLLSFFLSLLEGQMHRSLIKAICIFETDDFRTDVRLNYVREDTFHFDLGFDVFQSCVVGA